MNRAPVDRASDLSTVTVRWDKKGPDGSALMLARFDESPGRGDVVRGVWHKGIHEFYDGVRLIACALCGFCCKVVIMGWE
jgi:hypothetical protein